MASRDDYTIGWVCALPIEVAAAKAALDHIYPDIPVEPTANDTNTYILGSIKGHNIVLAHPKSGEYGSSSVASVVKQLRASFKFIRFSLLAGIGGGVPNKKGDIRLGDVVVSKPTAGRPGLIQYAGDQLISSEAMDRPSAVLLTAVNKTETADIFDESQIPGFISDIVQTDPVTFAHPGPEQDVLFDASYDHTTIEAAEDGCNHCNPEEILSRPPRDRQDPVVHYGLVASGSQLIWHGATRDKLAHEEGVLCFETEAAGLTESAQNLVIRGIGDYADSHSSNLWHAYAAAAAAAYAKEVLSFIPAAPKSMSLTAKAQALAQPVLDALLLTRPEVDRASLIALKGRRVDGTCEWLVQRPSYREWLIDTEIPLLWISGGPGKGKTMLGIYITEVLQPVVDSAEDVLLYYFCSNRDKNRNTAVTILRGIIHQWLTFQPHLAQHIKQPFDGTETTKYTVSSFIALWRIFLTMLEKSGPCRVFCVLDGLDECEKESLGQLLDAVGTCLSNSGEKSRPRLKVILLSRPRPVVLENKLGRYQQIRLDEADAEVSNDVEKYVFSKVAGLATEQNLSEQMAMQVRQTLLEGAEGTFLWVGFVANELKGRNWDKINEILHSIPKSLGGIYQRLLRQVENKEVLVPILQWVVLAARPLTVNEFAVAIGINACNDPLPTEVMKDHLAACGLLLKIEKDVVNLVHESAKEFFQSEQVNVRGISMFHMSRETHCILLRACLALIERSHGSLGRVDGKSPHNSFLNYASLYWPEHFKQAIDVMDAPSEFSRPFFQDESPIREKWWTFYWKEEKNGGDAPSFTLLHLAAYLGNLSWAKMLLDKHARLISRKDSYGRTPLSWAVSRGHRGLVELLLDHGALVNAKDRSRLTALHIAVTGEQKEIACLLLDRNARLEDKTDAGDTPLIRAIQANSKQIVELLLQHGARVDGLPTPPGVATLKRPTEPVEERASELLKLQEQLFAARYQQASRRVEWVMKAGHLSFRIPYLLDILTWYLKFMAIRRPDSLSVLQELVNDDKIDELRGWAEAYRKFFVQLVAARKPKRLKAMTDLPTEILSAVSPADLKALLVIAVLVGSETKLAACRRKWREGDAITAKAFTRWTSIACSRDAEESLHYGFREFLVDFDGCIQSDNRDDNVARSTVLLTCQFAMLENKESRPIEYFATATAEFYESYIGGPYEDHLFGDMGQACANELSAISEDGDSDRLLLFFTTILSFAQRARGKGQDQFLNIPPAACLLLCQKDPKPHLWLIGEALPETMSALISQQDQGPLQKRAYMALVECLIVGRQYGLVLPAVPSQIVKQRLQSAMGVDVTLSQILGI